MRKKQINPIWQPIGHSTHQIAQKVAAKQNEKTTHTGTLDPMAEGVVVILSGNSRFKKHDYSNWKKTYVFDIAFGIATDTYDGMGIIKFDILREHTYAAKIRKLTKVAISKVLKLFQGPYIQKVPLYSAIRYQGKPLHELARSMEQVEELPEKEGTIYKIKLLDLTETTLNKVAGTIINKISQVHSGDFRQNEIIKNWSNFEKFNNPQTKIKIASIQVQVSRGMYVRSLSQDIAQKLSLPGFVYSLTRTKNGPYSRTKCQNL